MNSQRLQSNSITNYLSKSSFSNLNIKYFELTNNCQTIKKTYPSTEWIGAICKEKCENGKVNEFSIRIDLTERSYIYIGFATTKNELFVGGDLGYNEAKFSWMCNLANGKFKNGGVNDLFFCDTSVMDSKPEVVFTICIDLKNDLIYLKRNGEDIGSRLKLQISNTQKNELSPCIDILEQNDQISIV